MVHVLSPTRTPALAIAFVPPCLQGHAPMRHRSRRTQHRTVPAAVCMHPASSYPAAFPSRHASHDAAAAQPTILRRSAAADYITASCYVPGGVDAVARPMLKGLQSWSSLYASQVCTTKPHRAAAKGWQHSWQTRLAHAAPGVTPSSRVTRPGHRMRACAGPMMHGHVPAVQRQDPVTPMAA
jgi:hypothetical protein